jgi:plasmid stabilization system protein ParE
LRYAVNSELAEADLADIWVEIAVDDIDTADLFIQRLQTLAQKLSEQPFMGREQPELGQTFECFRMRNIYSFIDRRPTVLVSLVSSMALEIWQASRYQGLMHRRFREPLQPGCVCR